MFLWLPGPVSFLVEQEFVFATAVVFSDYFQWRLFLCSFLFLSARSDGTPSFMANCFLNIGSKILSPRSVWKNPLKA